MVENLIQLSRINGRTLTFDPNTYFRIRAEHRIVGKLIGIPVVNPRNASLNGLPAIYNDYETKLLIDRCLVSLIDKHGLKDAPSEEINKTFQDHQNSVLTEYQKPYIEKKLELTRMNMDRIIKGRIKKLRLTNESGSELLSPLYSPIITIFLTAIQINPEDILREEIERLQQTLKTDNTYSQIPTQHPFPVSSKVVKDVPNENTMKYKIFEDLWMKGFFITLGHSFGGDFLVYPGDPDFFHASQIIHVVDKQKDLDLKFLISSARLSVSVKKKCMFAYVNEDDSVTYQEFAWDNPKLNQLYSTHAECSQSQETNDSS